MTCQQYDKRTATFTQRIWAGHPLLEVVLDLRRHPLLRRQSLDAATSTRLALVGLVHATTWLDRPESTLHRTENGQAVSFRLLSPPGRGSTGSTHLVA